MTSVELVIMIVTALFVIAVGLAFRSWLNKQ